MTDRRPLRPADMAYIALFSVLMAVCAWVAVPAFTIPFTMQTFGVFLSLTVLGGRRGMYAVGVYLLLGLTGLPVFTGFQGGPGVLLSATGGYLTGFLACALVFRLLTRRPDTAPWKTALAALAGLAACYASGTIWFLAVYARTSGGTGLAAALGTCVLPYLLPDLMKLALALTVAQRIRKHIK